MIRRLLPAALLLTLALPLAARADALDDDLAAAKKLLLDGNVDDAAARLDSLEARARLTVSASPSDAHAQYILGMAAMYAGHDKVAKSALDMAVRVDPKNPTYVMARAQLALYSDDPKEAVRLLQAILPANDKHLELLEMLGHAQQAAQNFTDAQATFEQASALAPTETRYLAQIAECLLSQHKDDQAIATYQKAIALKPTYALAYANIGQIHQTRKEYDKALAAYAKVVELDPTDFRAIAKLVQLNEALGKLKERDAARDQIFALFKAGKVSTQSYCREQFTVDTTNIMVTESFELAGPRAVRYAFNLLTPDGKDVTKRISLGSYMETTALARETGQIKADQRMFHLDVYTDSSHETLGMFTKEPTYEEAREMVRQYLSGKLKPLSATVNSTTKPATTTAPAATGAKP